ncbi:STAS domain-containing protein [Streptomyces sp. NPDC046261]|uniref:STAS domain-containing protein n=1 Tax=Streptomyces sp. NPDC046261 TaxID=3157200 RepID=UPI0033E36E8E
MTNDSSPDPRAPAAAGAAVTTAGEGQAVLTLSGELDASRVRELEEALADSRLIVARGWLVELDALRRMDLTCAYALRNAASRLPAHTPVRIRGANRLVRRTLRHVGIDALATLEG